MEATPHGNYSDSRRLQHPLRLNDMETPIVIAHRGIRSDYPENTLAAFEAAADSGIAMIELDVALTRDRQVIVIHDEALDRTTNGTGRVREKTYSEIRELDAGSWFDPRFAGEKVPSLEEVLERLGHRCRINIEIKSIAVEFPAPKDAVENQVLELIRKFGLGDSVVVSSFHTEVLFRIRRMDPYLALGVLSNRRLDPEIRGYVMDLGAYSWNPDFRKLTTDQVRQIQDIGVRVIPYTVNGVFHIEQALDMGVDGFFTDNPLEAMRVVEMRKRGRLRE